MNRIEKSYKLRNECLTVNRVFTDDYLQDLYDYVEDEKDRKDI